MTPFFHRLIWPALVLVALVELIFAQSQHNWILVTIGVVILNIAAFAGLRFSRRAPEHAPAGHSGRG